MASPFNKSNSSAGLQISPMHVTTRPSISHSFKNSSLEHRHEVHHTNNSVMSSGSSSFPCRDRMREMKICMSNHTLRNDNKIDKAHECRQPRDSARGEELTFQPILPSNRREGTHVPVATTFNIRSRPKPEDPTPAAASNSHSQRLEAPTPHSHEPNTGQRSPVMHCSQNTSVSSFATESMVQMKEKGRATAVHRMRNPVPVLASFYPSRDCMEDRKMLMPKQDTGKSQKKYESSERQESDEPDMIKEEKVDPTTTVDAKQDTSLFASGIGGTSTRTMNSNASSRATSASTSTSMSAFASEKMKDKMKRIDTNYRISLKPHLQKEQSAKRSTMLATMRNEFLSR